MIEAINIIKVLMHNGNGIQRNEHSALCKLVVHCKYAPSLLYVLKKKLWIIPLLKSHIRNGFSKQGAQLSTAGLHAAYFLHKWRCSFE